jgi:hypothetical protein
VVVGIKEEHIFDPELTDTTGRIGAVALEILPFQHFARFREFWPSGLVGVSTNL